MKIASYLPLAGFAFLTALTSCSDPHFFPRFRPLFPGLDEQTVSQSNRTVLSEAKADFIQVKHGSAPIYAQLIGTAPHSHTKIYQGKGYTLNAVNDDTTTARSIGPDIVISPSITGGKPYHYDEVDWED